VKGEEETTFSEKREREDLLHGNKLLRPVHTRRKKKKKKLRDSLKRAKKGD